MGAEERGQKAIGIIFSSTDRDAKEVRSKEYLLTAFLQPRRARGLKTSCANKLITVKHLRSRWLLFAAIRVVHACCLYNSRGRKPRSPCARRAFVQIVHPKGSGVRAMEGSCVVRIVRFLLRRRRCQVNESHRAFVQIVRPTGGAGPGNAGWRIVRIVRIVHFVRRGGAGPIVHRANRAP
jgi:hypothetical protein